MISPSSQNQAAVTPDPQVSPAKAAPAAYRARPAELQDWLNTRIYHPCSWRLARALAPTAITPNMVSVFGAFLVVVAGLLYVASSQIASAWPLAAMLGMVLHMTWHIVDGADGDLARMTGRSGPHGEMVDGLCDYGSHTVVYLMLGWSLQLSSGAWVWFWVVGAGLSRIAQANHYEVQRRQYQWWAFGSSWLRQENADVVGTGAGAGLTRVYLKLADILAPGGALVDAQIRQRKSPEDLAQARQIVRAHAPDLLPHWRILGANSRTILLGVSMLAGSALYYFAYELVVLNILLVCSIVHARAAARRLTDDLAQHGPILSGEN